ncbi:zinc ABC transporter substrate-binding protein ZnuA [Vibrio sonorensis]|uniref:zinc ABC transporter substrate-binding protein ZnuA n=1 Tax=Vibrio sonorensis TaxID=1004316 RepID=UPI0008D8E032|nr:zinc ABC transporter substrate-binding protein ZnuA [Vibrio sonorensis]
MKRLLTAGLLLNLAVFSANAADVLTSIRPIQMITTEITKGVSQPEVLLGTNTSPHDYALKPSDVRRIQGADLVIWFGRDLEPFLEKSLSKRDRVLTLSQVDGLALREFAEGGHDHHDHHGHDHGTHDPHFWLGHKTAVQVAQAITKAMAELDPNNQLVYEENLKQFEAEMQSLSEKITKQLAPVKSKGYYVFHDAYAYFEEDYGLNQLGHFTVSPERKPGAKTLIKIRKALAAEEATCVFKEPQYTPAVVQSVTRGSSANIGELDPLGASIEVKSGSYFVFLQSLADSFETCLSK